MDRIRHSLALVTLLAGATISFVLPSAVLSADKTKLTDGKKIFETKCLKCHKPEKFKIQAHDKKGWEIVLNRMVRNGSCELNEREVDVLSEYLAETYGE